MDTLDNGGEERGRPFGHVANFATKHVTSAKIIDAAIRYLAPGAPHRAIPALLFDNRAAPFTVRAWRMGMRAVPPWAWTMLEHHIARRLAPGATIQEAIRAAPAGRGQGWNRGAATLAAWRVRKAAERDAQAAKDAVP